MHKLIILLTVLSFSCKAQQIQQPNLATEIIGTWVSNDEPEYKVLFTSNGLRREYINNDLQLETYQYSIVNSCNGQTLTENYQIFLKITDIEDGNVTCDFLNGIHTDSNGVMTLSITTERGKLYLYTKQ